jgi:hypothetical protein
MKINPILTLRSKAVRMLTFSAIAFPLVFSACKKDENKNTNSITEEEAVEVAAQAVAPESGGLVLQTNATLVLSLTNMNSINCGVKKDSTITKQGGSGTRTYSYTLNWSRILTCTGAVPSSYTHTFSGSSSYTTPKMSSSDQSTGSFTIAGLEPTGTELTISQTYERNGTQESKVNAQRSFTSKLSITTTAIKVNKLTKQIISGAGVINISGTSTGGSFNYSGTITFNGGNKATIAIVGGDTHTIQW